MVSYDFPRPAVTVDLATFQVSRGKLRILLIQRPESPFAGEWTLPGGFVHEREALQTTARRILSAKASLSEAHLEQLATFGAPERDPRGRVISIAYFAILDVDCAYEGPGDWFAVDALPETGFDHSEIIATAIERLRGKLSYTDIGFAFMPAEFTLGALQKTWEAVLGTPLDKRNFRKSILSRGDIESTGRKSTGGAHPPAMIYHRSS
ncbi:MAG: NUDIX domain-containing protein [Pseudomonadota bacterium]